MKPLRSFPALLLTVTSALVWFVPSCASDGVELAVIPPLDGGGPDTNTVINPGPDAAALQACTDGRWCAVAAPTPGPFTFNGIWGSGANDIWLVASPDIAVHFDGISFASTHLNTKQTIFGIWGSSPSDLWAFSTGDTLWHHSAGDVAAWSAFDTDAGGDPSARPGIISGLWGSSPENIWAIGPVDTTLGNSATVWHCDGWNGGVPNWTPSLTTPAANPWDTDPSFNTIWGASGGEVWVVGDGGKTRYSSGWKDGAATWTVVDSGTSLALYALWGASANDVWAAGSGGVVRHFTRQQDGTIVTEDVAFPSRATIRALSGFSANDIWAGGSDGTLAHWDGTSWSLVDVGAPLAEGSEIFALWASGPEDVWAVGRNTFLHRGSRLLPGTTP